MNCLNILEQIYEESSLSAVSSQEEGVIAIQQGIRTLHARSRQSAKLFLQSSELGTPHPHPQVSLPSPPLVPGWATHSLPGKGWEFRRGDRHCGTLGIYVLCAFMIEC
jgi:hypothetical protein